MEGTAPLANSVIDLLLCKKPVEQCQRSLWMQQVYSRLCGKCTRTDVYRFLYVKIIVFFCVVEDEISVSYSWMFIRADGSRQNRCDNKHSKTYINEATEE